MSRRILDAVSLVEERSREARWLLEGVLPAGGLVLLAGETSSGKGFLSLELAIGVASRGVAWGLRCGLSGRVLYLCSDADEAEMARRMKGLCAGYGCVAPKRVVFDFNRYVFAEEDAGGLTKMIRQEGYEVVIVDPLSRYLPWMNDNSTRSVGIGLQTLREISRASGATVVMAQGFNKLRQKPLGRWGEALTDGTERVRGSTELVAASDAALLVRRGTTRNVVELVKNRMGRARWGSFFSVVDMDGGICVVFEAKKEAEVKAPVTLAELLERRMKRVLRGKAEKKFLRTELVAETKKLLGQVGAGQRAWAEALALLGKDAEILVEKGEGNFKVYGLKEPSKAMFDAVAEEQGSLSALDLLGKKIAVEAPLRLLEKQLAEMELGAKPDVLGEVLRRINNDV
ncbi:MAG: AAA family ATPase [Chloroflexi bacterium]|nr:AAA family ATPase [Chloroflexota bacterium]